MLSSDLAPYCSRGTLWYHCNNHTQPQCWCSCRLYSPRKQMGFGGLQGMCARKCLYVTCVSSRDVEHLLDTHTGENDFAPFKQQFNILVQSANAHIIVSAIGSSQYHILRTKLHKLCETIFYTRMVHLKVSICFTHTGKK